MKEIKFKGKRVDNREWVYGYLSFIYVDGKDENGFIYTNKAKIYCQDESRSYDVATKSIGQFIRLLDKNRKEIYIGDILNWENECTILIKEKDELGFYYEVLTQKDKNVVSFDIRFYRSEESAEVIGNIFGNPELMEVKDERNKI